MNTDKRRIAMNRYYLAFPLLGAFLLFLTLSLFSDGAITEGAVCGIFASIFIAGCAILLPVCYSFDKQGVTFCYLFLKNARYRWDNVSGISICGGGRRATFFQLEGPPEGPARFYMDGRIPKNRRTKRLLEAYQGEIITDDIWENLREWWNQRKQKRQIKIRQHMTDEIVPMERQARKQAQTALAPYKAQATQLGWELRSQFRYIPEGTEPQNSRPHSHYTYAVIAKLHRSGENITLSARADLLHVRLSKSGYRGVRNEKSLSDLGQELAELLKKVQK